MAANGAQPLEEPNQEAPQGGGQERVDGGCALPNGGKRQMVRHGSPLDMRPLSVEQATVQR